MNDRPGFTDKEKKRMLISTETLLGLRRTGIFVYEYNYYPMKFIIFFVAKLFVEFVRYLFSLPEVKENKLAFLSNHICQDPLENYFGCQRQRGGTSDNPTVQEYYKDTEALRVVNSFCRGPVRGNCRGQNQSISANDCAPIMKRRRIT